MQFEGVANIFPGGDIEGLLRGKAEGLLGIASVLMIVTYQLLI